MNAVTARINTRFKFHSPLNRPIQRFSGRTLFKLTYSIPTIGGMKVAKITVKMY